MIYMLRCVGIISCLFQLVEIQTAIQQQSTQEKNALKAT